MDRSHFLVCALALVLLLAVSAAAEEGAPPAPEPASEAAAKPPPPYWVLEEFDWGDDEEVVKESIEFDPYYECDGVPKNPCLLVGVEVAGEKLIARFHHHEGGLWQVAILTPDLDPVQSENHLGRVWQLLVDYVSQKHGEPAVAFPLPDLDSLGFGAPQVTHFWSAPDLEARVAVGRRDDELFYTGLFFSDPVRGAVAREGHEANVAATDEKQRKRRANDREQRREQAEAKARRSP